MITICTHWESKQMEPELELRMWRQLKGAYKIRRFCFTPVVPEMLNRTVEQFDSMQAALETCEGPRIFLEPGGDQGLSVLQGLETFTLVLGNTNVTNKSLVQPERGDLVVRIKSPGETDLYGLNAAAIALAHWYGQ